MYTGVPSDNPAAGLIGLIMAGSAIYIVFVIALAVLSAYISYRIIKAAVRNGVIEAMQKTGNSGGQGLIQGYPPAQNYGAPAAPHTEYSGYSGPAS